MGIYADHIVPRLIHLSMRNKHLRSYRARVAGAAQGRVLEIGVGSGLNLPYYRPGVTEILGLDPSAKLLSMARRAALAQNGEGMGPSVRLLEATAEAIPLDSDSIDSVVMTWTACSIPDAAQAMAEVRRVLRPGGWLYFVEHGRAPEPRVARWQDRLTPLWRRCAGGCHLNRKIDDLVTQGGFVLTRLETGYIPGPKPLTFLYDGAAQPG